MSSYSLLGPSSPIVLLCLTAAFASPEGACPQALLGTWEYRQAAGAGYDSEGERIVLTCADGVMRGVYFGLEREGEHGLFYTAVEMTDLKVSTGGDLSFTVGERELFSERPKSLEDVKQKRLAAAGLTRDALYLRGRIENGALRLTCTSAAASCPEKEMAFHKGK